LNPDLLLTTPVSSFPTQIIYYFLRDYLYQLPKQIPITSWKDINHCQITLLHTVYAFLI
jgi:hypothetical protein